MLGLIKKELLTIKSNLKAAILVVFIFTFMAFQGKQDMAFLLPFICTMLFISTFSYDEYNNWNAYAITLPNGRKNVVKSKYLATLILTAVSSVITTIISLAISYSNNNFDLENILSLMFGSIFAVIIIIAILYPLIFKFGIEKGRIFLFIGVFVITALFGLVLKDIKLDSLNSIVEILKNYWMIVIPILAFIILITSYLISKKIYFKKEF